MLQNHLGTGWQRAHIAWSPNNRHFAVTYWAGWAVQTFIVDAYSGEASDLMSGNGFDVGMAAWSPDGKKLAAVSGDDMDMLREGIWLFSGGHQVHLLPGACEDLAWSPDSTVLLATCELYYWHGAPPPLDQSSSVTDTAPQQGGVWGGGQLWQIETEVEGVPASRLLDLVQRPLVAFGTGTRFDTARHPIWSPDGKRMAFEVRSEDKALALKMGIAVANADGSQPRLVTTKPVWLLDWLPDGKLLVRSNIFAGQIAQYTDDLYALDPETGAVDNLTRLDPRCDPLENMRCQGAMRQILTSPGYAGLSPGGQRFYFHATGRSQVIGSKGSLDWLVVGTYPLTDLGLEYSAAHEEPGGEHLLYPDWLADGQLAHVHTTGYDPHARAAPGGNISLRFVTNGEVVRREDVGTWEVFSVGWAPDGSRATVATDFGVIIYGLPGR